MKTLKLFTALSLLPFCLWAAPQKIAVLAMDSKGLILNQQQVTDLLRIETEKINLYQVMDRYDQQDLLSKKNIEAWNCLGKTCLVEAGKLLGVDRVIAGSAERYDEKIVINLRMINPATGEIDKSQVKEFINVQPEIENMIALTLQVMLGLKVDEELNRRLTHEFNYESAVNNPGTQRLPLSGPRMGITYLSGANGARLTAGQETGGYDAFPIMSQFGYQFETQYLSAGNFQALVEFIPTITGIDQGYFIPGITLLNGFRNSKNGLEFAFGPVIGIVRASSGYYENNTWHLENDWAATHSEPNPNAIVERLDQRGDPQFTSGFVFAVGKTFKSGALNIPVNAYIIPDRAGTRFGLSFGFNLKK